MLEQLPFIRKNKTSLVLSSEQSSGVLGERSFILRTHGSQRSLADSLAALLHGEPRSVPRPPPLFAHSPPKQSFGELCAKNEGTIFALLLTSVTAIFLVEVIYYTLFLNTWFDEANFAYKSWLTGQGLAFPFINFADKYPSFIFYLESLLQNLFGPSLLATRLFSAVFLLGIGALLLRLGKLFGGRFGALAAFSLLVFNPYLVGYYTSATPYAIALFLLLLALWFIAEQNIGERNRIIFSSIAMTLAMLVRYNLFPAVILLWIYIGFRYRRVNLTLLSIGISLGLLVLSFIPYGLLDLHGALAWFLAMFGPLLPFAAFKLPPDGPPQSLSTLFGQGYWEMLQRFFEKFFFVSLLFAGGIFAVLRRGKARAVAIIMQEPILSLSAGLALVLFAAHFLAPRNDGSLLYSLYFMPLAYLTVVGMFSHFAETFPRRKQLFQFLFAVGIFLSLLSLPFTGREVVYFTQWHRADSDLTRIARGGAYLASLTTVSDKIISFDSPHDVFLAGRVQVPQTINGEFTYRRDTKAEELIPYSYFNHDMLTDYVTHADVIVFQQGFLPETILGNGADLAAFNQILEKKFKLVGSIENVYPRKYTRGTGVMEVYRRK